RGRRPRTPRRRCPSGSRRCGCSAAAPTGRRTTGRCSPGCWGRTPRRRYSRRRPRRWASWAARTWRRRCCAAGRLIAPPCAATCHRLGTVGQAVGPDLAQVRDKDPDWLLVALLDPNQAVDAKYLNYTAVLKNGVTLSGVVSSEGGNSLTLTGTDGKPQVVLRA